MTKQLNGIFETCSEKSLNPETSALITLAAQLAQGRESTIDFAGHAKYVKDEAKLHRAACLAACTAGPAVGERFEKVLLAGKAKGAENARKFSACKEETLDKKTHHLVSLAACLASNCECAAGHIIEARNAGATDEELARCACLTACVAGERTKYTFLAQFEAARDCRACDC
jgi:alkylhydroperoxidase/carboxymuconolactone decarboxylase family protein YurZ